MQGELDENNILVPTDDHWAQGKFGTKQWSKFEQYITEYQTERQKGKKLIVALHHSPFHTIANDNTGGLNQADEFMNLVTYRIDFLLFGHTTPTGLLQQSFPEKESAYGIHLINCANFEHLARNRETEFKGDSAKQICVGQNHDRRLEIFYVGTNEKIYHNWQTSPNGGWAGEAPIGGEARQICVGRNHDGRLEVF